MYFFFNFCHQNLIPLHYLSQQNFKQNILIRSLLHFKGKSYTHTHTYTYLLTFKAHKRKRKKKQVTWHDNQKQGLKLSDLSFFECVYVNLYEHKTWKAFVVKVHFPKLKRAKKEFKMSLLSIYKNGNNNVLLSFKVHETRIKIKRQYGLKIFLSSQILITLIQQL